MVRTKNRPLRSLPRPISNATIDGIWSPVFVDERMLRHIEIGRKSKEASEQGIARRQNPDRDLRMFLEFQAEWERSQQQGLCRSKTHWQRIIGKRYKLEKTAATDAIKRGENLARKATLT